MKRSHESRTRGRTTGRPFRGISPDRFRQANADRMEAGDRMQAGQDTNSIKDKKVQHTGNENTSLVADTEKTLGDDGKPAEFMIETACDEEVNDYNDKAELKNDEMASDMYAETEGVPIEPSNDEGKPVDGTRVTMDSEQNNGAEDDEVENVLTDGDTNFSDLEGIDMEIIDCDDEGCLVDDSGEDTAGLVVLEEDLCDKDVDESNGKPTDQSANVDEDDLIKIVIEDSSSNDDMVEFLKSFGVKGATGLLELTIAGVPSAQVVLTETAEIRMKRKIIVRNVHPSDLGSTIVQELFRSENCVRAKLNCERELKHDDPNWHGHLELTFGSADVATDAMARLRLLRDDVKVDYCDDSSLNLIDRVKMQEAEMKPWIGLILIVKNIGETSESHRVKLSKLFPDADIVFHKDNPTEVLKGKAYLIFRSKDTAEMAIKMFKRDRPKIDGRRLILLPWDINQILPEGMLKIGERRLAIMALMETEQKLAKHGGNAPYLEAKHKALCAIVARDTKVRHACGFPAPSYNQMKSIPDVRDYSDAEQGLIMRRLLAPYHCGVHDSKDADDTKLSTAGAMTSSPTKRPAKTIVTGKEPKSKPEATKSAACVPSTTNKLSVPQVAKQTATSGTEKKAANSPVVIKPAFNKQSPTASNAAQSKKPVPQIAVSKSTPRADSANRSFVQKGKTPAFNKQSRTPQKTVPSTKPTPLLDLPLRRNTGTGLLGTPPPVQTLPFQKPKPLLSLNPGMRRAPGLRSLLPEPRDLLPAPLQATGRSSLLKPPASHESDSVPLLKRPTMSNTGSNNSAVRYGILGSHPMDDDEPASKVMRSAHHQHDYNDLRWTAPDSVTRFSNDISQQVKDNYGVMVARERLTQTIMEEGRSKTSSLIDIEMNRPGVAQNRTEDRASVQQRGLLDMEISGPSNRNVDRLSVESRVHSRSVLDIEMNRPEADWRDNRVTSQSPGRGRGYRRTFAPHDRSDQMNSRLNSFDPDEARSQMSRPSDRGLFDCSESPAQSLNQGLPRGREGVEWNKPAMFGESDNVSCDESCAWNVNSRNDVSGLLSARSSSPMYERGQWPRAERQEDFGLLGIGSNAESRRWQGVGLPDAQRHGDSQSDQSDTVSLLLNLSQLLADKLQRDREKKRNQP